MFNKMCYALNRKNKNKLNLSKKQDNPAPKLLFRKDLEEYDFDFKNMLGWQNYPNYCYATIIDNKIVSCASAGYHADSISCKIVGISTITHKDYRGKGYSVSNVVALCEYILNMQEEKIIHYLTDNKNIASQKTALAAGLMKVSYCYIVLNHLKYRVFTRT